MRMSATEFISLLARTPKDGDRIGGERFRYSDGDAALTLRAFINIARAIGRPESAPRQRVRPGVPWLRLVVSK
jgi:hypothetical protein